MGEEEDSVRTCDLYNRNSILKIQGRMRGSVEIYIER